MSKRKSGMALDKAIGDSIKRIKAEMRRIGMWDVEKPSPEKFEDMGPFGMNTMAFEQWLRWVFIPNVEGLLNTGGPWPGNSDVGVAAMRNFDGLDDSSGLVRLLHEFDILFSGDEKS